MKTVFHILALRIIVALAICALTALAFMKFAGGAAMFCIDPPAATPGWRWKVPLAWAIIYGVSTFLGVAVGSFRARDLKVPIVVALITMGAFIALRFTEFSPRYPYFSQTEAHSGIPAMLLAGVLACILTRWTRKAEPSDSADHA